MIQKFLMLTLVGLLTCLPMRASAQSGRLSITDIETLLRDALGDPAQRPLLRLLRATVCGSAELKQEIDPQLLGGLGCANSQQAARNGPSFDCRRASTSVERLICRDSGLAALDMILADAYAGVMERLAPGDRTVLRQEEARWVAGRDRCASAANTYACVTRAYSRRIQELNGY